jgi:hypothetical protein
MPILLLSLKIRAFQRNRIIVIEWGRDAFLEHVCMKAGLPNDALTDAELLR